MEANNSKIIDAYLLGEMSAQDVQRFETELSQNEALQQEVQLQKDFHEAAKRNVVRAEVKDAARSYHFTKKIKWFAGGGAVLLIAALAGTFLLNSSSSNIEGVAESDEHIPTFLDSTATLIPDLEREIFTWSGKDSLYLSKTGVLISIPEGALLQNGVPFKGQAIIEWQEARDGATIMRSGLSTTSNGNLLETQGMFSLRASDANGNLLDIDPNIGIYVQVPVDEIKPGMQLYEGEFDKNGVINWVNPTPMEKIPVPIDMAELNFYPAGYEDTLNKLQLNQGKKYRDSLYLACEVSIQKLTNEIQNDSIYFAPNVERTLLKVEEEALFKKFNSRQKSQYLFDNNCATCHKRDVNSTGPFLKGVRAKWKRNGLPENAIFEWVRDWQIAANKYPYAKELTKWSPVAMSRFPNLTDDDIRGILDFIDDPQYQTNYKRVENKTIPPSSILAFWKPKFNNTNLATREFELRMQAIHQTCDENILRIYTSNLSQPLWYSDSLAMKRGHKAFEAFYTERVGAVNPKNPHLKSLDRFYEEGIAELKQRIEQFRKEELAAERAWDGKMNQARMDEILRTSNRKGQSFNEEYNFNLNYVGKQLGPTQGFVYKQNATILNIDRQVYEATLNRKTTTIAFNGKESTIQYNDFTFEVENPKQFGRLFAYLLPDKFNSYERIDGTNGKFSYPLNDRVNYTVVVLGINEGSYFYHEIPNINAGEFGKIELKPINAAAFEKRIEVINSNRKSGDVMSFKDEFTWLKLEQENYQVQRLRQEKRAFLERMRRVVFPCYGGVDDRGDEYRQTKIELE
jgi:cytochrome c551/c552